MCLLHFKLLSIALFILIVSISSHITRIADFTNTNANKASYSMDPLTCWTASCRLLSMHQEQFGVPGAPGRSKVSTMPAAL
jgi:hypothetical protein